MSLSKSDEPRYQVSFTPYSIEPMRERDLDEVVVLEEITGLNRWGYEAYRRELLKNPDSILLVARNFERDEQGRSVVGFLAGWTVADEVHINNIASHPSYRGIGIGRSLMQTTLDEGRLRGASFVVLEVRASNSVALGLYRKLGFRPVGRRRDYYRLPVEDAIVMKLDLK